jgi:hypothetical protein
MKAGAFPPQIVSAIRECHALVVLLTAGANESTDVPKEVQIAHDQRKLIVPLVIGGTRPSDELTYHLTGLQQIPWTEPRAVAMVLAKEFPATKEAASPAPRAAQAPAVPMSAAVAVQRPSPALAAALSIQVLGLFAKHYVIGVSLVMEECDIDREAAEYVLARMVGGGILEEKLGAYRRKGM